MMSPDVRPLDIVLVGSRPDEEASVLKLIKLIVSQRHNVIVQPSVSLARTFFEGEPPIDAVLIYHDPYNQAPISLQVAGWLREFYPDVPIGVVSPSPVDRPFVEKLRRMCGDRVIGTSSLPDELATAMLKIERLVANPNR